MTSFEMFVGLLFSWWFVEDLMWWCIAGFWVGFLLQIASTRYSASTMAHVRETAYLGIGVLTLVNLFMSVTAGWPAFVITALVMWIAGYITLALSEKRFFTLKEYRDYIFPYFYAWGKKK